jgi:hypothetical protein
VIGKYRRGVDDASIALATNEEEEVDLLEK